MDYQWSDFGVNRPAHSWEPALARFMTTIVRLRARNQPNWTEVGVARDIIPSMSIELVTQVSFKSVQPYSFWSADFSPKFFWPAFRFFLFFSSHTLRGLAYVLFEFSFCPSHLFVWYLLHFQLYFYETYSRVLLMYALQGNQFTASNY